VFFVFDLNVINRISIEGFKLVSSLQINDVVSALPMGSPPLTKSARAMHAPVMPAWLELNTAYARTAHRLCNTGLHWPEA
jgi:hypothetical protein